MDKVFLTVLNMSLTGALVITAICIARLALRKSPKMIAYCLWAVAGFRLIVPFSIGSVFSLMPIRPEPVQSAWVGTSHSDESSTLTLENVMDGNETKRPDSQPAAAILVAIGSYVWPVGAGALMLHSVASYIKLKRKMRTAVCIVSNVYEAANIKTPFVFGVISPKIYIPAGLSGREQRYIILHEQTHVRRLDHLVKIAAYLLLCLHWFNPLAWAAFLLMGTDMEMACDESVLKEIGIETKRDYSQSLLRLATQRRFISGSPLAFGEGGVKERVKNVLRYRKRSKTVVVAAVLMAVVFGVGFSLDRATDPEPGKQPGIGMIGVAEHGETVYARVQGTQNTSTTPEQGEESHQAPAEAAVKPARHGYVKLSAAETGTFSFGRIMNTDILPDGRYYTSMDARGDELLISYINID